MRKELMAAMVLLAALIASVASASESGVWDDLDQVYFGDLHVHTNYSLDAWGMGIARGRYADEAGMYAAYCSKVDFYSVTDHAEMLTDTNYWEESVRAARKFNELGRANPDANGDPSIVAFTGWEWTQPAPWGHKNVIFPSDDPDRLPPSPIRCSKGFQGWHPYGVTYGYLKPQLDLRYYAPTPADLFGLLRETCTEAGIGCDVTVIPHGNAWGFVNMQTSWTIQMDPQNHDPKLQRTIEVSSKHGNSEEYRPLHKDYKYYRGGAEIDQERCEAAGANCEKVCQAPTDEYEPCCYRAGLIVAERCVDPDSEFCKKQIELAREAGTIFPKHVHPHQLKHLKPEFRKKPGKTNMGDWRACGQCLKCYQPAYRYNANGSVQRALVTTYFDDDGKPMHYKFGFLGSTDTHSAWPGPVKESKRNLEQSFYPESMEQFPGPGAWLQKSITGASNNGAGPERLSMMFNPGSLIAIHAPRRNADDLWTGLLARNVYSTTGPRIEVWAKADVGAAEMAWMGSEIDSIQAPTFHLKVKGAFEEDPTCPYDDEPAIAAAMSREEFERVCLSQCHRTLDARVPIDRIEVVKVLQPLTPAEANMENFLYSGDNPDGLIMDPYFVADFNDTSLEWSWTDDKFMEEPGGRSVAYYFRVIQIPTEGYSCGPITQLQRGEFCDTYDPKPLDVDLKANPRDGGAPTPLIEIKDNCYTDPGDPTSYCQERAVTSPFYVTRK